MMMGTICGLLLLLFNVINEFKIGLSMEDGYGTNESLSTEYKS